MFSMSKFLKALYLAPLDFEQTTDLIELSSRTFGKSRSLAMFLVSEDKRLSGLPDSAERIEAISEVFADRSYRNRLWVVQEIRHAAEGVILCGNRQIDFTMMALLTVAAEASPSIVH